jgi:hypothetical protein
MKYRLLNLSLVIASFLCSADLFAKAASIQEQQTEEKHEQMLDTNKTSEYDEKRPHITSKLINEDEHADKSKESTDSHTQKGAEEAEETLKIGNLAFPPSQQPSPLVSFGQNIINRKQMQAQLSASEYKGKEQYFININPALIYAFTDAFSIFLVMPFAPRFEQGHHHSSGPQDAIIQFEYAFYTKAHHSYYDQATLVANVTIPTGSTKKNPSTGVGANSFFIGGTFSRMEVDWFWFVSPGVTFNTSSHQTKHGNQYLYQGGFGRRITNTDEWLFDWMVEMDGTYSERDKIRGKIDPHSGGNIIYLTPSLWISSKESLNFQIGIGFPIYQHLFGHQKKFDYQLISTTDWLF